MGGDDLGLIETGHTLDRHQQKIRSAFDVECHFAFGLPSRGYGVDGHGNPPRIVRRSAVSGKDNDADAPNRSARALATSPGSVPHARLRQRPPVEQAFVLDNRLAENRAAWRWGLPAAPRAGGLAPGESGERGWRAARFTLAARTPSAENGGRTAPFFCGF